MFVSKMYNMHLYCFELCHAQIQISPRKLNSYLKFINLFLSQEVKAYDCKYFKNVWL